MLNKKDFGFMTANVGINYDFSIKVPLNLSAAMNLVGTATQAEKVLYMEQTVLALSDNPDSGLFGMLSDGQGKSALIVFPSQGSINSKCEGLSFYEADGRSLTPDTAEWLRSHNDDMTILLSHLAASTHWPSHNGNTPEDDMASLVERFNEIMDEAPSLDSLVWNGIYPKSAMLKPASEESVANIIEKIEKADLKQDDLALTVHNSMRQTFFHGQKEVVEFPADMRIVEALTTKIKENPEYFLESTVNAPDDTALAFMAFKLSRVFFVDMNTLKEKFPAFDMANKQSQSGVSCLVAEATHNTGIRRFGSHMLYYGMQNFLIDTAAHSKEDDFVSAMWRLPSTTFMAPGVPSSEISPNARKCLTAIVNTAQEYKEFQNEKGPVLSTNVVDAFVERQKEAEEYRGQNVDPTILENIQKRFVTVVSPDIEDNENTSTPAP